MLKIVKAGGLTIGAGLIVGASAIGWMRAHSVAVPVSASGGGSVVLGASSTPVPSGGSAGDLHVSSPNSVAAAGGAANTLLGGSSSSSSSGNSGDSSSNSSGGSGGAGASSSSSSQPSPTPVSSVPSPAEFAQYNKYATDTTAYFGDEVVGTGTTVVAGTTLNVLYRGWLTNGMSFDAETDPSKPFVFKEGDHKVIPGWEEGLLGMKVGGIRRIIVPPSAGYGAAGHPPIPANAVLVFDVQLTAAQ